jgi:hypothetical protein
MDTFERASVQSGEGKYLQLVGVMVPVILPDDVLELTPCPAMPGQSRLQIFQEQPVFSSQYPVMDIAQPSNNRIKSLYGNSR